jgi:maleylacetoacetate isomerase/maleylpyruvate isomerase
MFSAERFGVDLAPYPRLREIYAACSAVPAFAAAHPSRQADAEP